jgi:hypothetical protein
MEQWAKDTSKWRTLKFDEYGFHATVKVKVIKALYYLAGKDRLLTIVLVRDTQGKRPGQMFELADVVLCHPAAAGEGHTRPFEHRFTAQGRAGYLVHSPDSHIPAPGGNRFPDAVGRRTGLDHGWASHLCHPTGRLPAKVVGEDAPAH